MDYKTLRTKYQPKNANARQYVIQAEILMYI